MSNIYLIRHAQASFGAENYDQLSDLGHQQSIWLGEYLAKRGLDFDQVYLGNMVRHRETLEGITRGYKNSNDPERFTGLINKLIHAEVDVNLNEYDFKSISQAFIQKYPNEMPKGNTERSDFYRLFKKAFKEWQNDELTIQSESYAAFKHRALSFLSKIQNQHKGESIVVVTSGGVISLLISEILQTHEDSVFELNMQTRNSSIAHCFFNQHNIRLSTFNQIPHLDTIERQDKITYS